MPLPASLHVEGLFWTWITSPLVAQCPSAVQIPGSAGHSESEAHAWHAFATVSQIGFVFVRQSELATHSTQVLVDALHAGFGATQSALAVAAVHPTQAFVVASHAGVGAAQSVRAAH